MRFFWLLTLTISAVPTFASSAKSRYTLFNPTPAGQMREFNTDRPDKTEGAFTVDAGHIQVETDIVNFAQDKTREDDEDITTKNFGIGTTNFRVGLTNSFEVDLIVETFVSETVQTSTSKKVTSGFGNTTARVKWNLIGNDEGPFALALLPFVKFPTSDGQFGNKATEGGLIIPLGFKLSSGFDLGLMIEGDARQDEDDNNFHAEWISSASLAYEITDGLGAYLEFFSPKSAEEGAEWVGTVDFGVTYEIIENLQLDTGVNFGVSEAADDINVFAGISARF